MVSKKFHVPSGTQFLENFFLGLEMFYDVFKHNDLSFTGKIMVEKNMCREYKRGHLVGCPFTTLLVLDE